MRARWSGNEAHQRKGGGQKVKGSSTERAGDGGEMENSTKTDDSFV